LQRRDVDLMRGALKVERSFVAHPDGSTGIGPPKTDAGVRTVTIPTNIVVEVRRHLVEYVGVEPGDWLFPGESGRPGSVMKLERAWWKARR
jgi:hypothetical protein